MKKIRKILVWGTIAAVSTLVLVNLWIVIAGMGHIRKDIESVTAKNIALVPGTSKRLQNGNDNPFFYQRIESAWELYKSGKVKHFILSGDNREKYYNEPLDMKNALMDKGVPESAITLDYAGLSTLDSVVRSKVIFGQDNIIVVTQKFHSYRTSFLCQSYGIEAEVYLTESMPIRNAFWVHFREFFARGRAFLDVYILKRSPRHLGDKIDIIIE